MQTEEEEEGFAQGEPQCQFTKGIILLMIEDDSSYVRIAAINVMSHFATLFPEIRKRCLHAQIDMLNDEIDYVRIAALHGIQQFNSVLSLEEYELDIVLFNLNEDNTKLREEIYKFFMEVKLEQEFILLKLLEKLTVCIKKFQGDKEIIFKLMKALGKSHAYMVQKLLKQILDYDERYLTLERDWKDMAYVSRMVLVFHAA